MTRERRVTIKDAAYDEMPAAYAKASASGTLPALARQIMYAARPAILARTGLQQLNDEYFTQQLLPNFMSEEPRLTADWNVVFDARGNFVEPHTDKRVPLGTLNVRDYLAEIRVSRGRSARFRHPGTASPDDRTRQPLRSDPVRRERGLQPAVRGGAARRAPRPGHHVDQRHERHREPGAGRIRVQPWRAAPGPARLRQIGLLDRRHAHGAPPAATSSATATPAG